MAATMDIGLLPTIKCSNCGRSVEISVMGDHVCEPMLVSATPPPPPPKSHSPSKSMGRSGIPPPIDPSKASMFARKSESFPGVEGNSPADQPFMRLEAVMRSKGDITPFPGGRLSPPRQLLRSQTTPLPTDLRSSDQDEIPKFPLPRSMSQQRSKTMVPLDNPYKALPVPQDQETVQPLKSIRLPLGEEAVAPPPLPKDDVPGPLPTFSHKHSYSTDSRSSYRTSIASSRYDSRRSTSMSIRRPSFGSMAHQYKFMDDAPPLPSMIPSGLLHDSTTPTFSESTILHNGVKSGEDQEIRPSALRVSSHTSSDRLSSTRGSAELFFRSPTLSSAGTSSELPDFSPTSPTDLPSIEYRAYKSPGLPHPQPPALGNYVGPSEMLRKNSDAISEGGLSITNFARELGLDDLDSLAESSTGSSDSSPSDTRSGTSLSSIASDVSLSRRNPSDQGQLGTLVDDLKQRNSPDEMMLDRLEPPRMPDPLFSPDSPTDPAISAGSVSLIRDKPSPDAKENRPEPPPTMSPTRERAARAAPRPKGPCRGCSEMIFGKSVSSADGRLTGRYHRACFVCYDCKTPFKTADFYVMDDHPYCAQHYHQRNGSLCHTCRTGIEGEYLETVERRGHGPADSYKFHPDCLTCRTCQVVLKGDYFEWNGQVYCERDARRAAASVPPAPRFQRPGPGLLPPSPLPHARPPSRGHPRPPPPGYPGRPGSRPGTPGPPGPPGPPMTRLPPPSAFDGPYGAASDSSRRFPARRTTKLMMI